MKGALHLPVEANRRGTRVNVFFSVVAGLFFLFVFGLIVFAQGKLSFAYAQNTTVSNLLLLPFAVGLLALAAWLRARLGRRARPAARWGLVLAVYFPLLLLAQLVVARSIWYYPGWDVLNVYRYAGDLANGIPANGEYFRLCPNNAPLTVFFSLPLRLAARLGLAVPYSVLPYLGMLMVNLACLFGALSVGRLTRSRFARYGCLTLNTLWIAFSITGTIPYTDAFAILFPVLALYLYLAVRRPFVRWLLVTLVCFVGASVKPTVLIVEIAMLVLGVLRALPLRGWGRRQWLRAGSVLLAVVLGAVPGKLWQDASTAYLAGSAQPQEQLSETHYLMLGMNAKTFGGHSPEDVTFSTSFATLSERRAANLARAWERLSGRTLRDNAYFFSVKAFKAFSDGMLAANQSYLTLEVPKRSDALSRWLRQVYYIKGSYNEAQVTATQCLWLMILLLCLLAMLGRARRRPETALIALTLFGLGCYLLLFEVWPRYLFVYAPLFVALASVGLAGLRLPGRPRLNAAGAEPAAPSAPPPADAA